MTVQLSWDALSWTGHFCSSCKVQWGGRRHRSPRWCDVERRPAIRIVGQFLAPEDIVECHVLKLVFDGRQLIGKGRPRQECDLPPDCLIFEEGIKNAGVSVVSWSAEIYLLAMAVLKTKLEGRFVVLVSKIVNSEAA